MTTTDRMDMEQLRCHAVDMDEAVAFLSAAIVVLTRIKRSKQQQVNHTEGVLRQSLTSSCRRINRINRCLCLSMLSLACHIDHVCLDIQDLLCHSHEVVPPPPSRPRKFSDPRDDNQSESLFGFKMLFTIHLFILTSQEMNSIYLCSCLQALTVKSKK